VDVDTSITVRCACGWETSGPEDVVIEATVEHGRRLHNMVATREQVLAMAIPAVASDETSDARVGSTD
jgi:predicted small metal-binding protein